MKSDHTIYDNDACKLSNKSGSIFASASKMICTSTPCNIPNSSTFYNSSPPSLQLPASLLVAAPSLSSRPLKPTLITLFTCHLQFSSSPTKHFAPRIFNQLHPKLRKFSDCSPVPCAVLTLTCLSGSPT